MQLLFISVQETLHAPFRFQEVLLAFVVDESYQNITLPAFVTV